MEETSSLTEHVSTDDWAVGRGGAGVVSRQSGGRVAASYSRSGGGSTEAGAFVGKW